MGRVFQQGQELGPNDLKIFFTDQNGDPITYLEVRYSLYLSSCGASSPCSDPYITIPDQYHQAASVAGPGAYYAQWNIPHGQNLGLYQVRWDYRVTPTSQWKQLRQHFQIVKYPVGTIRTAELSDMPGTPIVIVL